MSHAYVRKYFDVPPWTTPQVTFFQNFHSGNHCSLWTFYNTALKLLQLNHVDFMWIYRENWEFLVFLPLLTPSVGPLAAPRVRQTDIFGFSAKNAIKWHHLEPSVFSAESSLKFWTFELSMCLKAAPTARQTDRFQNRDTKPKFWDRSQLSVLSVHFSHGGSWTISFRTNVHHFH